MGDGSYAGPADIWNPKKGFLVQSTNPESYNLNFPTTGAHNLYFDLLISGVDINELTWEPVTLGGITATVTNVVANDLWIPKEDRGQVVARVKLTGPEAIYQRFNPNPSQIAKPRLPQTFELVGRDIYGGEVVKYGFVLRQWFVNRGGRIDNHSNQTTWCNSLGYRMPRVRDLTNAVRKASPPISGAAPSSSGDYYMRHIGAGFFTEWGDTDDYTDAGLVKFDYWTSDASGSTQFFVNSYYGDVFRGSASVSRYGLCTAP
ncbi:hypothetical protein A9G26_00970 [Gilliamella sp. Bim1-2]|uniref:hypothetical protein n=1 Tax=Gilliamella sp. Bim1-2 TaxID=3120234 RepID=UPI00080DB23D|nr:hypothetical protein [Gilliamella apicola]OCG34925.1 hypothetical protein A9G32_07960 [Gilliamella apicola]OCG48322.1 hypothetical protein A9G26_00970 [Gilliamella apicola]OCG54227.1 hypothetical protein A9G27_07430 [Gilliamella apicola]